MNGIRSLYAIATCPAQDEARSRALPYAMSFAAAAGAHLTALSASVRMVLPSASSSSTISGLLADENRRLAEHVRLQAERFHEDAVAAGVICTSTGSHVEYGTLMANAAQQARVHDLTIVDADAEWLGAPRSLADAVLFEGGRPVMVIPAESQTFRMQRAIIAWDGSAMASRAVSAALPLLRVTDGVEVLCVAGEKDLSRALPGADLARYLSHHGVRTSLKDLNASGRSVADILRDQASMLDADLIVLGAFKHSRLREWALGGVTSSMLQESKTPLLMSH